MLHKGDKITMKKPIGTFDHVGERLVVTDVKPNGDFRYETEDCNALGTASKEMFDKYFAMYEEPEQKRDVETAVDDDIVDEIIDASDIVCTTLFDKCTMVACKLPNGFVIVEYSSCVDPADYDEDYGFDICMENIRAKVMELEAYRLQNEVGDIKPDAEAMKPLFDDDACDGCDNYDDCYGGQSDDDDYDDCDDYYDYIDSKWQKEYGDFLSMFDAAFDEYVKKSPKWTD